MSKLTDSAQELLHEYSLYLIDCELKDSNLLIQVSKMLREFIEREEKLEQLAKNWEAEAERQDFTNQYYTCSHELNKCANDLCEVLGGGR